MPQLNQIHRISGAFAVYTEERMICRRVARRALSKAERTGFEQQIGRQFRGANEDRILLPPMLASKIDRALVSSMRRHQRAWRRSPIAGRPVDRPKTCNLILNQMLDFFGARTSDYSNFMNYCCLGTSTTTPAVTDVGLGAEVVRTSDTLSSSTTDDNPTRSRTFRNVYDFPAETVNRNYTEVGLSYSSTVGNNLGTRALLSGGTVTVLVGQQARVSYSVTVTLPANYTDTPTVTGDTTSFGSSAGTFAYCTLDAILSSTDSYLTIATGSTIPSFGTTFSYGTGVSCSSPSFLPYTTGTYKSTRRSVWNLSTGNGSSWRSFTSGQAGVSSAGRFAFVFDSSKTKDNVHTLTVDWSITYGRA